MDEQRVWLRSRRKRRLRLLAAALCLSLLFTTYPDMLGFLSVFAAESQGEGSTLYVSRFVSLPKEVREQTVFTGTEAEELSLPDGLEAVVVMPEGGKPSEDAGEEKKSPEDAGEERKSPADKGAGAEEEKPADKGAKAEEEKPEDKGAKAEEEKPADDETKPEEPSAKDDAVPEPGEKQTDAAEGTGMKDTGTKDTGTKDTGESDNIEENTDGENKEGQDTQPEEAAGETAGEETVAAQEAHIVTMPEYHGGNVITVRSLENTQGAGTKEETVFIEGVTWKSEPAYDGNTEGTYVFTAVLPEGYALMEGAGLPQITVTVQDSGEAAMIQALLDRIAALPDAKEYLAGEPDTEEEEAYGEWMEGLYEYAEEALGIQEEYEALTEEQRAQIPEEALDRLSAWVKIAEEIAGNSMVTAATVKEWDCGADGNNVTAVLDSDGTLTISGSGAMADYEGSSPSRAPWYNNYRTKIKRVVIDSGVTSIGKWAFNGCSTFTEVTIPDSVTSIGEWAFRDCNALTEVVIPNGVTSVEVGTFYFCRSLRKVTIPDGVTSIGDGAFSVCRALTEVTIPNGVTSIKSDAFRSCSSLTEVTIPNSVTSIGFNAFYDCTSLATVTFEGTDTIPTLETNCFNSCSFVTNNEKGIKVPCQYLDTYKGQTGWSSYEAYIIERHNLSHVPAKAATCAEAGNTEYWKCSDCGSLFSDSTGTTVTTADAVAIAKLAHSYSYTASGAVITETCDKGCGHSATATLSIKSGADLIYTGSEIKPVTVTYSSGWAGTGSNRPADTAITYTNNINAGAAAAELTISGKTARLDFIIYSPLPSGKSLTDYITVSPSPDENGWYHSDITLTPKSGCEAGETPAGIGSSVITISEETGPDGSTKTIYIKDSDGSFYQTEFSYKLDKTPPAFSGEPEVRNRTQEGGDIAFTSTEDGKAYWLVSDAGTKPGAQEVVNGGAKKGSVKDVTGGLPDSFTVTGLSPKETYTVYVVLMDAAGNLSEVKEVSLTAEDPSVTEEPALPGDNDDTDNPADTTQPGTSSPADTTQPGTSSPTDTTQPGTSSPTDTTQPGTSSPAPAAKPAASSGQKPKSPSGKDRNSGKRTGTQSAGQQTEEQEKGNTDTQGTDTQDTDTQKTGIAEAGGTGTGAQQEREGAKTVPASIDGGRIVISGGAVGTGSLKEDWESATLLAAGDGAVIVTVVCEDGRYAAGVKDTAAVANAVLTKEQIQLVNDGGTIEIRIDVKDISETAAGQDKEVMESGLEAYREELPGLTPGRYVDISLFVRTGEGSWDAVASTGEPIEVVMGVPEELKEDGREFYIIRSHEGEYTLLNDLDSDPDTITISTDLFSAYVIAYRQVDGTEGSRGCGLCHICPTFLGICCFVWLAVVLLAGGVLWFVLYKKKRGRMEG